MLKGIDPILNAEILYALRAMGHGDDLILADMNFPADSVARQTRLGRLLRISLASAAEVTKAILSLYPVDTFVDDAVARMMLADGPEEIPPVQEEVQQVVDSLSEKKGPMVPIERFAFYERARNAYCVIQTGERRFYGCFAIRKGVIAP
ncbi:MAG: ribose ABC transporter [Albidovulum sp.]|nr:ribose ABC transporter [Albidovulum sp.]MDE0304109.1 ribose ABC transporter [Albidovulum sp.]MDE0533376.1 ribose ABC transporter [Albidovulum sp.]